MNLVDSIRKVGINRSTLNIDYSLVVICLFPIMVPIIYEAIEKMENIIQDVMVNEYDIKVKAGNIEITLSKN